jgi:hypothetical protein
VFMKVLVVHNAYQQRGGENAAVTAKVKQLATHGDTVLHYERHNDELRNIKPLDALRSGVETLWGSKSYRELKELIAEKARYRALSQHLSADFSFWLLRVGRGRGSCSTSMTNGPM